MVEKYVLGTEYVRKPWGADPPGLRNLSGLPENAVMLSGIRGNVDIIDGDLIVYISYTLHK